MLSNCFILACVYGHKDVVQLLLDCSSRNIGLNSRENDGKTPLMLACHIGHKDVVQLFLDSSDSNIELNVRGK